MRARPILLMLLLSTFAVTDLFADEIPLVYDVENTGADFAGPVLPTIGELKTVKPLTDPFCLPVVVAFLSDLFLGMMVVFKFEFIK